MIANIASDDGLILPHSANPGIEFSGTTPLYDHLVRHPRFTACIDAWWIEPVRHGEFRIDQPFLDLPNVIASPHNSAQGDGSHDISLRRAVENCRRALTGEAPLHAIGLDERLI